MWINFGAAACSDNEPDPTDQVGANPTLPEPIQYLVPPMHVASVIGWKQEERPTVAKGLQIQAFAKGLKHPRSLYKLPNGDVLVVESVAPPGAAIKRPKDLVMG